MIRTLRSLSVVVGAAGLLASCAPAVVARVDGAALAPAAALMAALDSVMRAAFPADQPGAAAIVVRDGEVLLRGGYGMADLELGVPLRAEHVFRIGSVTKQFTGAAILLLARDGLLSLDDPLERVLPDFPTGGRTVTVRHLLAHTSGIRSYTDLPGWPALWRRDLTTAELIELFRDEPFDFEPGERWSYSNSGYILLGAIVERLAGMSYGDFVRARIFEPLGMTSSSYADARRITPNRIPGYSRPAGEWVNAEYISMTQPYAAGSLLSSVDDLARWDAAIAAGELLGEAGWREAFAPASLADGRSTAYAAGWMGGRLGAFATAEHGGGIHGFISYTLRAPAAGLYVAVLANADLPLASPERVGLQLADLALGGVLDEPAVAVDAARLREYVGVYRIDEDATRTITLEDGTLRSQRTGGSPLALRPIGEDLFQFPSSGSRLRFERAGGEVTAMVLEPRVGPAERTPRTTEPPAPARVAIALPSAAYDAFPGTYRVPPNLEIRVTREGDRLYAQATGQERITLLPEAPTRFFVVEVDAVLEFRVDGGRAVGFTLRQAGQRVEALRVD
jgi:D-alanyl-D-alanine carboxypeptidase